jgi:hypothetical protein
MAGNLKYDPQEQAICLSDGLKSVESFGIPQHLQVSPVCRDVAPEVEEKDSVYHDVA